MDRLAIISAESARLADVLSGVDPDSRCPTCPDWSAADLLWHLINVHLFWARIIELQIRDEKDLVMVEESKPSRPRSIGDMLVLRAQATDDLVGQLAQHDDADPCWSWWPSDQTVGFTRRMQTYEATMHRVDAELTASLPVSPMGDDVAAGAVDQAVDVMWGWMPDGASYRGDATVEFLATDTRQRWLVEVGRWTAPSDDEGAVVGGPRAVRASAAEPSATVEGRATDLALWTWTRGGSVRVSGEPSSVAALNSVVARGMP